MSASSLQSNGSAPVAVVLLNLGAPEGREGIPQYIRRLLADPDVMPLPWPVRTLLAWVISCRRAGAVSQHYAAIGGRSPLGTQTCMQVEALRTTLGDGFIVRYAFRHSPPFTDEVFGNLAAAGVHRVVALPLYPQYSQSTTGSGLSEARRAARRHDIELAEVRSYPDAPGYIKAVAARTVALLEEGDYVLFSAHGLPMRTVLRGDPYVDEMRRTMAALADKLPPGTPHSFAFQSRVGRMEWTRPYLADELTRLGQKGVRSVVVVPLSFVSENLETLYELDLEHAELARKAGIALYRRVPTPGVHPAFIGELARLVREAVSEAGWKVPHGC